MSQMRLRLFEGFLTYPPGQEVHTAASGRIDALHEIYLVIDDRESGTTGAGEIRANITFITGTPEAEVVPAAIRLCGHLAAARSLPHLEALFAELKGTEPRVVQALVENALVDLEARRRQIPAAEVLGGCWKPAIPCNECVFWGSDADMAANMQSYRALGFAKIKLRVGIGTLQDDLRRLAWLRGTYGQDIELAVDANGAWDAEMALRNIEAMGRYGITYVEQPTHKGDWDALERVAAESGYDIMIDEGLQSDADVARVCANKGRISAHLKIAKAGGARAMVAIGRKFDAHGVAYVVGQMNEGALATAIAVHCAMALSPRLGELYGALGIENEPATPVGYAGGSVAVPRGPGTGVVLATERLACLWDSDTT